MRTVFSVALLSACTGPVPPPADASPTGDTGTEPTFTLSGDLVLEDGGNYRFDQTWDMAATDVRASFDLFVDWSGRTSDAWGVARDPSSYGVLSLTKFTTTRADVLDRLADDDLESVVAGVWTQPVAGLTEARTSEFSGFDVATMVEDPAVTWLLALADDAGARLDIRDGLFVTPKIAVTGFRISIPAAAETVWSVQFGNDELRTDSGHDAYSLNFGALTTDAYGKPFDPARVDEVFVGRFTSVDEADDLGGNVLDLKAASDGWWSTGTGGFTTVQLRTALDDGGQPFPGFTTDAAWLVGGRCLTCLGPAPQFLAVVEVRDP